MGRAGFRHVITAAGMLAALGLAACDDDRSVDNTVGISQERYDENLAELCAQHGTALAEAGGRFATEASSDAERVAYFRTDWIPRVRTIILGLNADGFPAGAVAEYVNATDHVALEDEEFVERELTYVQVLSHALEHLEDFEANAYTFIDAYAEGRLEPEDNYVGLILEDLAAVGITCVT